MWEPMNQISGGGATVLNGMCRKFVGAYREIRRCGVWADVVIGPYSDIARNTVGRNRVPIGLLPDGERRSEHCT